MAKPPANLHSQHGTPFYRLLSALRLLCQLGCVMPVLWDADGNANSSIFRRLHHLWLLCILVYTGTVNFMQAKESTHPNITTVEKGLYLSEFITNTLIIAVTLSSCYYYASYYASVTDKLLQIYKFTLKHKARSKDSSIYETLHRELRLIVVLAGSFLASLFAIDFVYNHFDVVTSVISSSAYNLPNVLISLNLGQYWLALRYIYHLYGRLNALVRQLHRTELPSNTPQLATVPLAWYKREFGSYAYASAAAAKRQPNAIEAPQMLELIRAAYADLDGLMARISEAFALIIVLNLLGSFLDLAVQNFAVYKFCDKPNIDEMVLFNYKLLWLVLHVGRIFFILSPNNAIIREKCRTAYILNELPAERTPSLEQAVNRFLLQLMVRKQCESACGIISLDLLYLGGITSALATYVIFLIQIDLGNESLVSSVLNKSA